MSTLRKQEEYDHLVSYVSQCSSTSQGKSTSQPTPPEEPSSEDQHHQHQACAAKVEDEAREDVDEDVAMQQQQPEAGAHSWPLQPTSNFHQGSHRLVSHSIMQSGQLAKADIPTPYSHPWHNSAPCYGQGGFTLLPGTTQGAISSLWGYSGEQVRQF